jgi:hypothetical protein
MNLQGVFFFCLRSWDTAVLLWPLVAVSKNIYSFDLTITALVWHFVSSIDDYFALPTSWASPLRLWQLAKKQLPVCIQQAGFNTSVLLWQASEGFAGVTENVLKKLHDKIGAPLPDPSSLHGARYKDGLCLSLIAALMPSYTETDAWKSMRRGQLRENPLQLHQLHVSEEMLHDVVLQSEHKDMRDHINECELSGAVNTEATASYKLVSSGLKWQKPTAKSKVPPPRWKGKGQPNLLQMTKFLDANRPPAGSWGCDSSNALILLAYPGPTTLMRKSISWQVRGELQCCYLVLRWLWEQHIACAGDVPAWPLDAILQP